MPPYGPGGKQYVGGRATSARRRQASARYYDGRGFQTPTLEVAKHLCEADDENAVLCPNCDTYVAKTAAGKPCGHAPGGYAVSITKARLRCVPLRVSDNTSLPVLTAPEAKAKRLVTQAMVSGSLHADQNVVTHWFDHPDFPKPVATMYHQPSRRFRNLYPVDSVMRFVKHAA